MIAFPLKRKAFFLYSNESGLLYVRGLCCLQKDKRVTKFKALIIALLAFGLVGASYTLIDSSNFNEISQPKTESVTPATSDCPSAPEECSTGLNVWAAADQATAVKSYLDGIAWAAAVEKAQAEENARIAAQRHISVTSVQQIRSRCGSDFNCFRACTTQIESGGNYATNTGNGYYGAWQFNQNTWKGAVSRAGYPQYAGTTANNAPQEVQDAAAQQLYNERGNQPWGGRC